MPQEQDAGRGPAISWPRALYRKPPKIVRRGGGPTVHAILLMDDPSQARAVIQQTNKQLASHQQIRGFTIWPDADFPRTHTLKVKRPEVLEKLRALRGQPSS